MKLYQNLVSVIYCRRVFWWKTKDINYRIIPFQATGAQFKTISNIVVIAISALTVGFWYSWKLTLTILAFVPLIGLAGAWQTKVFGNQVGYLERGFRADARHLLGIYLLFTFFAWAGKFGAFVKSFPIRLHQNLITCFRLSRKGRNSTPQMHWPISLWVTFALWRRWGKKNISWKSSTVL